MSIYMTTWSMMPAAVLPMGTLIDSIGAPITEAAAGLVLAALIAAFALARRPRRATGGRPGELSPPSETVSKGMRTHF